MKNENIAERLLNEGLELLSSEKPQKQKKGLPVCGELSACAI